MSANGGNGSVSGSNPGGGGGGGRIAVTASIDPSASVAMRAYPGAGGGSSAGAGGAGTVVTRPNATSSYSLLVLSPSVVSSTGTLISGASLSFADMAVNNAIVNWDSFSIGAGYSFESPLAKKTLPDDRDEMRSKHTDDLNSDGVNQSTPAAGSTIRTGAKIGP